jgi:tetratricopeptide (TPR) repeat protein
MFRNPAPINRDKLLILVSALCLLSSPAFANEASFEKALARGEAALESNEPGKAAVEFRAALEEHPQDPEANLFLGIALSRADDPQAETALKKALVLAPDNQRTNLELGILYYRKNVPEEAADHFDTVIRTSTDAELTAQAREYMSKLDTGSKGKRWAVHASTGIQYDSNVVLNVEGMPLPAGVTRKSDWLGIVSLGGGYSLLKTEKTEVQAEYNFFQSLHFSITDYNITQNTIKLQGKYDYSNLLSFRGSYSFEQVLLGGVQYDYDHTVSASGVLTQESGAGTTVEARYRYTTYKNIELVPNNNERTGSNYQLGFTQQMPIKSIAVIRAGYSFDMDRADNGDSWDYNGHRVSVGVNFPLPYNVQLDLSSESHWRSYQGVGSYATYKRNDTSWTSNLMLNKVFSKQYSATAGIYADRTYSNVPEFDYTRYITSLLFNMRF